MSVRSHERGWPVIFVRGLWKYEDTLERITGRRECRRCRRTPTATGHDRCIADLTNVASACCGHGQAAPIRIPAQ